VSAIHHTGLTVSDLERALVFWRDGLGMAVVMAQEKQGGYMEQVTQEPAAHVRMAHLAFAADGPRIELFQYLAPPGGRHVSRPADAGFVHVCILVDEIEPVLTRLEAAGGRALGPVADVDTGANRGGRCVYVRDPDGHVVELFSKAPTIGEAG
jgi:catechol 2,3-dioxygenase-like lactoylglutathione lyase family enzyme